MVAARTRGRAARLLLAAALLPVRPLAAGGAPPAAPPPGEARIVLGGDVLLSRRVADDLARTGLSPLRHLAPLLAGAGLAAANLEGAAGSGAPGDAEALVFAIRPGALRLAAEAGFTAMGVANNHAADLGREGRERTRALLEAEGLVPLSFEGSPRVVSPSGVPVAVVALSLVRGRDGRAEDVRSPEVADRMRRARELARAVVVFVHWGEELLDWPSASQRDAARALVGMGATVVAGHHPHVVQQPECVAGRPVFFSLGNLLFDQRWDVTRTGLLADCRVRGGELACGAIRVERERGSYAPVPAGRDVEADAVLEGCRVALGPAHGR